MAPLCSRCLCSASRRHAGGVRSAQTLGVTKPIAHAEVSTVGGLVYSVLGRVPRAGDELTLDGYRVVVERVDQRRVTQVSFEKR